jgi:hypothetical protein
MKARIPKSYLNLPKRERDAIDKLVQKEYERLITEDEVVLFEQYTKMMCIVLHDYFGFGEGRLLRVIANFKNLKRRYRDISTAQELMPILDKEMERIFNKSGFPKDFVEKLQRE